MWFVYSSDVVTGPFSTDELKQQVRDAQVPSSSFVWWKGQREWLSIKDWETQLTHMKKVEEQKAPTAVWYVDVAGSSVGPLTHKEMLAHLRGVSNLSKVRLWTNGMPKWLSIFEMPETMEQLGMSRRENERAPLMGSVVVTRDTDDAHPLITKAASISIGGLGVNDAGSLIRGEEINVLIKSPEISVPMRMRASVVYVTSSGHAGLKFVSIHPETQSIIFDYVRKFIGPNSMSKAA